MSSITSGRVRIKIFQRDGSCPKDDEPCLPSDGPVPFPRGKDVVVYVVNDDGTETRLTNVKRVSLNVNSRLDVAIATLELFNPVIDVVVPAVLIESPDPGTDGFLGEPRQWEVLFKIGDRVEHVDDGRWGDVVDIQWLKTAPGVMRHCAHIHWSDDAEPENSYRDGSSITVL